MEEFKPKTFKVGEQIKLGNNVMTVNNCEMIPLEKGLDNPENKFFSVDVIIENPPFGTKQEHADRIFLDKALQSGKIIYTLHKTSTLEFLRKYLSTKGKITNEYKLSMPLKSTMPFHKKRIERIDVTCLRIEII